MSLYGKSCMFDNARKVFDEMPERNCQRTVMSFNALLAACVNSKNFDMVDGLFRELPGGLKIEPDVISYNTLIKAFCEMGSLDSACSVLNEMEKKGLQPDIYTFNTLLKGFYENGMFLDGERIWGQMVEKNLIPDVRCYNSKLLGLALEKRAKDAVELLQEMRKRGIKPDVYSFDALIKGFVNEENLAEAKYWYNEIGINGCTPRKSTLVTLIPFVCEKGDFGFAFELSKDCFKRKRLVGEAVLQGVVDGLVRESKIKEAEELVQLSRRNGYYHYRLKLSSNK
uniref:Pentatricopeptide repeat-containing protein n=1 Tax=Rhizophora mucronata TaxID=61149 RepID=A0A2P2IZZ1_RHIMU